MNKMKIFYIALFFITSVFGIDELEITLKTSDSLYPIYVSKIFNEKSNFQDSYLEKLQSIFKFDMSFNGYTESVQNSAKNDFKISHFDQDIAFEKSFWKKEDVSYVLKIESDTLLSEKQIYQLYIAKKVGIIQFKDRSTHKTWSLIQ